MPLEICDPQQNIVCVKQLTSIEGKLDRALQTQADHEARLRRSEEFQQQQKGGWKALVAVGSASGVCSGLLVKLLSKL